MSNNYSASIYTLLTELPTDLIKTGKIRIVVTFKAELYWLACPRDETIAWLMKTIADRYSKEQKKIATIEKLQTEKGALLDPTDKISSTLFSEQKVLAIGTVEASEEESKDASEKYNVERKLLRDEDTGEVVDSVVLITFLDQDVIDAIRTFVNSDVFYEKRPRVNAESLLQYSDQFKQSVAYAKTLKSLTDFLDAEYEHIKKKIDDMLKEGKINYSSLWSIFPPNTEICCKIGTSEHIVGSKIVTSKYNRSSWFPSFDISATVIKSNGVHFYRSTENYSISAFSGVRKLSDLPVRPLNPETKARLEKRGTTFSQIGHGAHYLNYMGNIEWKQWFSTNLIKADGRVMVDGVSFARMNANYRTFSTSPAVNTLITEIPEDLYYMCWPTIGGFSFSAKKWGEVIVDQVSPIVYDDKAFEKLVFPPEKKRLIRSLVENAAQTFSDIISGKGGGCIFLLHGAPGVGKTLTAEAISELLHRPLYSVSIGELGTNTKELEKKLRDILELAGIWNAVVLIDEADIFLEKRSENDIMRNAMVGIFLRLLEYHQGVLFLTTNRVKVFDEAFHSRISVALKYDDLNETAREQIWANLLETAKIPGLDAKNLAKFELNGRQIRTTIRLAQSLAYSDKTTVDLEHINLTVGVAQKFVDDMKVYKTQEN